MKLAKLGDICEISTGSTDTKDAVENGQYPLFDRSKKVKASDKYLFDCEALIMPGEGAEFLPRHYLGKFDLHQRAYAMFNFSNLVDPKYLYFYLISVKDYFANNAVGATVKSLRRRHFTDLEVPLPSLEKQREIVENLDSAYTEIALLEENLINRAELLERLLQGALSVPYKSAISDTGNSRRLGEIADFQGGSQPAKSNFLYKEQKGYVRFIQIRDFGSDKNLTYIPISSKNRPCAKSDILIGRYGASVGKILTGLDGAYNVALMKVTPKNEIVDRDYLYFYLLSEIFQTNLLNVSDRSAQNGFSKDDISSFPVVIPSLREQQEIVARLSKVRNSILELNLVSLKTKAELALLRKSLLNSAFTQKEAVA